MTADPTVLPDTRGLRFRAIGGPLVAVAALCGGAGASSLTALTATAAAHASTAPVMACDTGGQSGGLVAYLGVASRFSLASASTEFAAGRRVAREDLFAQTPDGVRVMAASPELDDDDAPGEVVAAILDDARLAHGLTVLDCGTLTRRIERQALQSATHVLWVMPATVSGVRRASRVLAAVHRRADGRPALIARHDAAERKPPMRELNALADHLGGPLVLMPHIPDLAETDHDEAVQAAEVALEAIGTVIRR